MHCTQACTACADTRTGRHSLEHSPDLGEHVLSSADIFSAEDRVGVELGCGPSDGRHGAEVALAGAWALLLFVCMYVFAMYVCVCVYAFVIDVRMHMYASTRALSWEYSVVYACNASMASTPKTQDTHASPHKLQHTCRHGCHKHP